VFSVDLVNYYGNIVQTTGREMEYTTTELFFSAMEKAQICDKERREAIAQGS